MIGRSCLAFHAPMIHIICPSEPLVTSGKSLGTELERERGKISPCLEDFARGNIRQAKDRADLGDGLSAINGDQRCSQLRGSGETSSKV